MVRKYAEIKKLSNEEIIADIFYLGVACVNDGGTKADEENLRRYYKELANRGVVSDWAKAYEMVCR